MALALVQALVELDEVKVLKEVERELQLGRKPLEILEDCRQGMNAVGDFYSKGEYFLSDLVMSAQIFREVMDELQPRLKETNQGGGKGKLIFGTVEGDIHDIGKNITVSLLRCHGVEVIDLGVDVPPDSFLAEARNTGAGIICLSALLTSSFESMKRTVNLFTLAGQRAQTRILIGGLVNAKVAGYVGADAWARDASHGVNTCLKWLGGSNSI